MPDNGNNLEDTNEISPYAQGFQDWLSEFTASLGRGGPDVVDLTIIMMNCMAKMRGVLLADELKGAVVNAVNYLEEQLEGEDVILAEQWRHVEGGYELYQELATVKAPDDLKGLTNALPDDFDLRD